MKKIKQILTMIVIAALGITALVAISLHGEKDYLKNCEILGIECQPGNVHQATKALSVWSEKMLERIRAKMSEQPSEDQKVPSDVSQILKIIARSQNQRIPIGNRTLWSPYFEATKSESALICPISISGPSRYRSVSES